MKLSEHVDQLRSLIEASFDKQFARLGIGASTMIELEKLPPELHEKRRHFEAMVDSHIAETGSYKAAREKLVDELTFTLFNRLAAVKVMEAASLFPPVLTRMPEHGDRSFGHKAWLEINPDMRSEELEGIREYIKYAFDELGRTLPLYSKEYPYALLPDVISLNEIIDAFNGLAKDPQVGEDIWQSDDVLGWMYESYNNAKKEVFKASKAKTEYNKVSLQSQVYTPRWVVQFLVENSLGKLYLEMFPDSEIKDRFKIANAPKKQIREPKPLHECTLIDPACGSGNFLLYGFDFFYELYLDQIENYGADYEEDDIPQLIIEHNLHGIDLDDRAVQLAQLGLFIKARRKRRTIGELKFKVVSSDFFLPEYTEVSHIFEQGSSLSEDQQELIAAIWEDLQYAHKFGSLIRLDQRVNARLRALEEKQSGRQGNLFAAAEIDEHKKFAATFFDDLKTAVEQYARTEENTFLTSKTKDAITFLELLTSKYDVATANPPYTDSSDFGPELKRFIDDNYKNPHKFHTNLYATFINRCYEVTCENGKIAMIHPLTFMFIKTFEGVRSFLLKKTRFNLFVHYGPDTQNLFDGAFASAPAFYVLEKTFSKKQDAWFVSLDQYTRTPNEKFKKDFCLQALADYIDEIENEHNYTIPQSKLKIIKSWPFIYWISDAFREKFKGHNFEHFFKLVTGLMTGNNLKFLRFFWEVDERKLSENFLFDNKQWVPYQKGGDFNKWYGNNWLVVNFVDNGSLLATTDNKSFYFKDGITYSATSSKGVSFRRLPPNQIFDKKGSCIFLLEEKKSWNLDYVIAVLNSKFNFYVINCLNSTVETQIGDVKRVPFIEPSQNKEKEVATLANTAINIKKSLSKNYFIEKEFSTSPLEQEIYGSGYQKSILGFFNYENHLLSQVLLNEAIINEKIFEIYGLTEHDKAMVLAKEGESIGGLPVEQEAREAYLSETESTKKFPLDNIREFIAYLPEKEFPQDERQTIENEFPSLYQKNNDLEEFCIRHQVNPINVWYWFKQSKVIPKQRMNTLAMEFLADLIREILMEDDDGIIPLVASAGEKILLERIEEKFIEKGFSQAQFSSFDTVLGRPLDEYINKHFFAALSDHLNLFMYLPKTPFIWHLSSGPNQGFDCYIIIYKWSRDNLLRIRSVYIEHRERALMNRQSDLAGNESAEAQTEKDLIFKQLKEIEEFKAKTDELLAEGYDPILDDGVGKNIAPLQKKKMIPYEVLNNGQLTKYLNADW